MITDPLDVLPLEKAKEYLNKTGPNVQPGGDDELVDMIGAAVERVQRHLGRVPDPFQFSEVLACKTVLAEYWETQNPARSARQAYGGSMQTAYADDGPAAPVPLATRLTALLGPAAEPAEGQPQGSFPEAQPWPDPIRTPPACAGWPR